MARTSGPELLPCSTGNLPSSARPDGMNGWTPASRRLNGAVKKMRSFYIWPNSCPLSGGPLHRLLGELLLSALSDMNIYCKLIKKNNVSLSTKYLILNYLPTGIKPRGKKKVKSLAMILVSFARVRSTPIPRLNPLVPTLKTWTKMNWRCSLKPEPD